jgi:TadE-like protein
MPAGRNRPDRIGRRPGADCGAAPLELVILAPVVLALIGLVIAAGRTSIAQGSVDAAARDAARQASISLSPGAARQAAVSSAQAALRADGLDCRPVVRLELSGFSAPVGQPAQVSATVSCAVPLSGLLVPGVPGAKTLTARFASPLDPYRSRAFSFSSIERSPEAGISSQGLSYPHRHERG